MKKIISNARLVKNPVGWICGVCEKTLTRRDALLRHIATVHGAPYTLIDPETNIGYPADKNGNRLD